MAPLHADPAAALRAGHAGRALIGYARVSTDDQNLDLQLDAMARAGVHPDYIYREYVSGAKTDRPVLEECMRALRRGDTLVIWRLDRLGRRLRELLDLFDWVERKGCDVWSLTEHLDTTSAGGRLIFHFTASIAQWERDTIVERTRAGLKAARLRGHRGGRKIKCPPKMLAEIEAWLEADGRRTMAEAAASRGISPATVYRARERKALAEKAEAITKAKMPARRVTGKL